MPRPLNREAYIGTEQIMRRLRAAKRPEILVPLEIPPEELDVEPETVDPDLIGTPSGAPVIDELSALPLHFPESPPYRPMQLSAHEILPDDEDD